MMPLFPRSYRGSSYNESSDQFMGMGDIVECEDCGSSYRQVDTQHSGYTLKNPDPTICYGTLILIKEETDAAVAPRR